jgi:hypothetical protein
MPRLRNPQAGARDRNGLPASAIEIRERQKRVASVISRS